MPSVSPHLYALCWSCADGLVTPRGWLLDDRRSEPRLFLKDPELPGLTLSVPSQDSSFSSMRRLRIRLLAQPADGQCKQLQWGGVRIGRNSQ